VRISPKKIGLAYPRSDADFHRLPILSAAESGKFLPIPRFCRFSDFADRIPENLLTLTGKCRFCRSEIATLVDHNNFNI
jgi:hypothetical protein